MILDTSTIIDVLEEDEQAVEKLREIENSSEPRTVASPTLFELWSGVVRSNIPGKEKEEIKKVIQSMDIKSLEEKSGKIAGRIDGKLMRKGEKIQPQDCMIAGIAINQAETVLTRDKDFDKIAEISGLKTENY